MVRTITWTFAGKEKRDNCISLKQGESSKNKLVCQYVNKLVKEMIVILPVYNKLVSWSYFKDLAGSSSGIPEENSPSNNLFQNLSEFFAYCLITDLGEGEISSAPFLQNKCRCQLFLRQNTKRRKVALYCMNKAGVSCKHIFTKRENSNHVNVKSAIPSDAHH